eukprot:g32974.t1
MTAQAFTASILEFLAQPWPMLLLKMTVVLAAGWCGHWALRGVSPRVRLYWWRSTVCALVLVAAVSLAGPRIALPVLAANASPAVTVAETDAEVARAVPAEAPTPRAVDKPSTGRVDVIFPQPAVAPRTAIPKRLAARVPVRASIPARAHQQRTAVDPVVANAEPGATAVSNSETASTVPAGFAIESGQVWTWLLGVWLAGVVVCAARLGCAAFLLRRYLRGAQPVPENIETAYRDLKQKMGCRAPVTLLRHDGIPSPVLYGIRRPVILIPGWMCDENCRDDWPGVFAHELSHVRSLDPVWQLMMHSVSTLLWFHPLAWRLRRAHVMACELKADFDSALFLGETRSYVRTLARVALASSRTLPGVGLAMARTSDISHRLEFLKKAIIPAPLRLRLLLVLGVCGLAVSSLLGSLKFAAAESPVAEQQQPAQPATENESTTEKNAANKPSERKLHVTLHDEQGKVIPGASVVVRLGNDRKTHRPDAAGNIVVPMPKTTPTIVILTATAPGHVRTQARYYNRKGRLPQPIPAKIQFRLERGTTIGGTIVDTNGKPIVGASVRISANGPKATRKSRTSQSIYDFVVKSDSNGRWKCGIAPSKLTAFSAALSHPEYVSGAHYRSVPEGQWSMLRDFTHAFVMERGFLVEGVVRGPDGKPIEGAVLALGNSPFGAAGRHPKPKTDKNGTYRFKNVKGGDTALTVVARGYAPELKQVHVGEELDSVNFQLRNGKTIRIRVHDKNGKPLAGATVVPDTWRGHRSLLGLYENLIPTKTDKSGLIVWNWAPEDEIRFDVFKRDHMSIREIAITPREKEYLIVLPPALRISGRVVDAETKKPIPAFKVRRGIEFKGSPRVHWASYRLGEGRDGKYLMEFTIAKSRVLIRIEADGYAPAVSRRIKHDEGRLKIDFELKKAKGPQGTVFARNGKPIAGAKVYLFTPSNGVYVRNGAIVDRNGGIRTTTDKAGRFRFSPQSEQYSVFVVTKQGYSIVPGGDLEANPKVFVEPWAKVEGTLAVGSKLGRNQTLSLHFNNDVKRDEPRLYFDYDAKTDDKGHFEFNKVPTHMPNATVSKRIVLARHGGTTRIGSSHGQQVELLPGKTLHLVIGGSGRPVIGKLKLPASIKGPVDWNSGFNYIRLREPPGAVRVPGVPAPFRPSYSLRINNDGTFRVEDIPSGAYELVSTARERQTTNNRRPFEARREITPRTTAVGPGCRFGESIVSRPAQGGDAGRVRVILGGMSDTFWTDIDGYITSRLVPDDPELDAALRANAEAGLPAIDVSPNLGKLLHLLARMHGARTILEIGTLGGYSTIWLARALPEDGRLVSLEFEPKHAEVARANIARAGLSDRVEVRVGPALETLPQLADEGAGPFDLFFIDADKQNNPRYFEWSLKLARRGSVIICDNVVRQGAILDPDQTDPGTEGTRRLYEAMSADPRVTATALQTVGSKGHDGFAIALVTDDPTE